MKKRIIFASFLTLLFCQTSFAGQEFYPFLAEVTTDNVNVRAGENKNFEKILQLNQGEEVVVRGRSFNWYKIDLPPQANVYISKKYVQALDETKGLVTAGRVNIRAGADINFTVVGFVDSGQELKITKVLDDWYQIVTPPECYGWVADEFVSFKSNDIASYLAKSQLFLSSISAQSPLELPIASVQETLTIQTYELVILEGYLQRQQDAVSSANPYYLVLDSQKKYLVEGVEEALLNHFDKAKVKMEGFVQPGHATQPLAALKLSKIQLLY